MIDPAVIARPYAEAAFEYAMEHHQLAQWSERLQVLAEIAHKQVMKKLLRNPEISAKQFSDIFIDLTKDVLDAHGKNFIKILAENRRLAVLPEIAQLFEQLREEAEKTIIVKVKSAVALDEAYQQKLRELLHTKLNRKVILECEIDPELIGGLLIRTGDRVIDTTVRGQLTRLREELIN